MKKEYTIYRINAWQKGGNSSHEQYMVLQPHEVEDYIKTNFDPETWDDGVYHSRETEYLTENEAEELIKYYQ
jgi:hypothetical protein